jgi:hypothetical protein
MARKNKRQQPRKPQRGRPGSGPARPPATGSGPVPLTRSAAAGPSPAAPAAAPVAPRPARPVGRSAPGMGTPQTAAIPLDRVPYFRADLRRIAITGAVMLAILLGGSLLIH